MFKNIHYNTKKSAICLWTSDGYEEIPWVPYVFVKAPDGEYKDLDGKSTSEKSFQNYNEYATFQKNNVDIYENKVKPEIQYLAERYSNIPDEEVQPPELLVYYIDIEVAYVSEFPHPNKAKYPVTLVSVRNSLTGNTIVFGEKEYTGDYKNVDYIHCPNERDLLRKFFGYMYENPPDVISGWNVTFFDMAYLIKRDENINDGKYYTLLSPVGIVKTWKGKNKRNQVVLNIDIAGVSIIDYMYTYQWYTPHNLESYKLDFVSKFELEKGKLDYSDSGEDLRDLYKNDWNKYVEYNIIDCERVNELDAKLGYIKLIQSLSLLTKSPMKYFDKVTQLVEGLMITHARRTNLCVPYLAGGSQEWFDGAYVKEPQKGKHSWLFSVDITSSYPSHIITLNMSTETYFGRIIGIQEDKIARYMNKKEFPAFEMSKGIGSKVVKFEGKKLDQFNTALKKKIFAIAPCGTIFINNKQGLVSTVERNVFYKRKEVKKLMRKSKGDERDRFFALQWALKILLNSVYGAMSVPYSRWFNKDIAEAITSCGRYTIKSGERFCNKIMNEPDEGLLSLIDSLKLKFG